MKVRTALVKGINGYSIIRDDFYPSNAEFAADLRGNGYKVAKVWARDVSDAEVDDWHLMHRK